MGLVASLKEKARTKICRIVFPEGNDERIVRAAAAARNEGLAKPILVGDEVQIGAIAQQHGLDLKDISIVSTSDTSLAEKYASSYADARDMSAPVAKKMVRKELVFGGMMVREGDADAIVAGVASATATVIQAATLTIGLSEGLSIPSSFFIMILPEFQGEKEVALVFADCGVTMEPDAKQLADICITTTQSTKSLLGIEPRAALLSFSTKGSANHPSVDKVREAVAIVKETAPDIAVDGELQADAALISRIAQSKVKDSNGVAGNANILIFPDLNSGNISYKLVQYLAGASAFGPVLQGFSRPVCDLSRGASIEDIVTASAIVAAQAAG